MVTIRFGIYPSAFSRHRLSLTKSCLGTLNPGFKLSLMRLIISQSLKYSKLWTQPQAMRHLPVWRPKTLFRNSSMKVYPEKMTVPIRIGYPTHRALAVSLFLIIGRKFLSKPFPRLKKRKCLPTAPSTQNQTIPRV